MKPVKLFLILSLLTNYLGAQLPSNDPNYKLVFEEKFDSTAVDDTKWYSAWPWNQSGYIDVSYCNNIPSGIIGNDTVSYIKRNFENCIMDTSGTGTLTIVSKEETYEGLVWRWHLCSDDSCTTGVGYHTCDSSLSPPRCLDEASLWFNYTTSMLRSKEKFKYGYFEIRCKIPVPSSPKT